MLAPRKMSSGKWQARITVTRDGESKQVGLGTFATKRDALDRQNSEQNKLRRGTFIDPATRRMTMAQWCEQYQAMRPPSRKANSFLSSRIVPHFGHRRLDEITPLDVQQWVISLNAAGLAPATVRGLFQMLRQVLGRAVDMEQLGRNPCISIDLPKMADREVVLLTVDDMERLERAIAPRFAALVHLGCWAGLRIGELSALRWQDVDLEAGVIDVCRSRRQDGTFGPPKSGKARMIHIAPRTVEVLRAHRRDFGATELLFTTVRQSRPLDGVNFRSGPWAKAVTVCGFDPKPTPHSMRHNYATRLAMRGVDWQIISEQLGHHNASFSMNRYGATRRPDGRDALLGALADLA